jgi:hypothetical protein
MGASNTINPLDDGSIAYPPSSVCSNIVNGVPGANQSRKYAAY